LETPAHRIHEQVNAAAGFKIVVDDKAHHYVCIVASEHIWLSKTAFQS
jgi:hypothetical protein